MSILLYNVGSENVGKVKHPTLQGYCALEIGVAVHVACKPILFLSAQFLTIVQFGAKSVHLAALQVLQTWYFPCHEFCCYCRSHIRFVFDFSVFYGIKLFFCGIAAAIAMVIPGISGSLLLLILGEYENISYFVSTLKSNFNNVYPLIFLGIGVIIGIFAISKLITIFIQKYRSTLFGFVLGILVVSFLSLWPNITSLSIPMLIATVLSMCMGFLVAIVMEKI